MAEQVWGLSHENVEHLQASVPKKDYGLPYDVMSGRAILMLIASGVPSGLTIFHAFRKDCDAHELVFSPHLHCLGYVDGYDRCRNCNKTAGACWDCDGFEGRTRRVHVDDGWVVSLAKNQNGVVEKRNNIFGTHGICLNMRP
jgi:hypothetical protein